VPDLYERVLAHISKIWPELSLVNDKLITTDGTPFYAHSMSCSLPFIIKNGLRYGCSTAVRTDADIYAGVDLDGVRTPCEIVAHFKIMVAGQTPHFCSVIRQFDCDEDIPAMPWDIK
jgi:hypothetical protein